MTIYHLPFLIFLTDHLSHFLILVTYSSKERIIKEGNFMLDKAGSMKYFFFNRSS